MLSVLAGYDSRDPYALADSPDILGALHGDLSGKRIAYSPDFGVYPVDPDVARTVASAVRAFEEAGAIVEQVDISLPHDHLEYADLWLRMIAPLNLGAVEGLRAAGIDLLGEYRHTMPPEYVRRVELGSRLTVSEVGRDQAMRTTVSDAVQGVLDRYDFLVTPTNSCMPVDNTDDGDTMGPTHVAGVPVERLIGWCMTYFLNFTGHPAASIPAGMAGGLPVGMQIIGGRYDDVGVITASRVFEQLRPWHDALRPLPRPLSFPGRLGTWRSSVRRRRVTRRSRSSSGTTTSSRSPATGPRSRRPHRSGYRSPRSRPCGRFASTRSRPTRPITVRTGA